MPSFWESLKEAVEDAGGEITWLQFRSMTGAEIVDLCEPNKIFCYHGKLCFVEEIEPSKELREALQRGIISGHKITNVKTLSSPDVTKTQVEQNSPLQLEGLKESLVRCPPKEYPNLKRINSGEGMKLMTYSPQYGHYYYNEGMSIYRKESLNQVDSLLICKTTMIKETLFSLGKVEVRERFGVFYHQGYDAYWYFVMNGNIYKASYPGTQAIFVSSEPRLLNSYLVGSMHLYSKNLDSTQRDDKKDALDVNREYRYRPEDEHYYYIVRDQLIYKTLDPLNNGDQIRVCGANNKQEALNIYRTLGTLEVEIVNQIVYHKKNNWWYYQDGKDTFRVKKIGGTPINLKGHYLDMILTGDSVKISDLEKEYRYNPDSRYFYFRQGEMIFRTDSPSSGPNETICKAIDTTIAKMCLRYFASVEVEIINRINYYKKGEWWYFAKDNVLWKSTSPGMKNLVVHVSGNISDLNTILKG